MFGSVMLSTTNVIATDKTGLKKSQNKKRDWRKDYASQKNVER